MAINQIIKQALQKELKRQQEHIELIASENFVNEDILTLNGSIFTNKYAEGYPQHRYYGGCENVDTVEQLAIDTLKTIFKVDHANVQPHSGSSANLAAYDALGLKDGDKVLGMDLAAGGHLTHGHPLNFSGKRFKCIGYGVDPKTHKINYKEVEKLALQHKPKVIIIGASAYSRKLNFKKMSQIAKKIDAYLWADIAHVAGLIAAGYHPSPAKYADIITATTHKSLRGPRGGIIMGKKAFAKAIDYAIFPGNQGGPLEHVIAAKAQCFLDVTKPAFKKYTKQVIINAKAMAKIFKKLKIKLITGGTDNHMLIIDVKSSYGISGKVAEKVLHEANITLNKNMIPFDKSSPFITSGIRIGTLAMTSRGMKEKEFIFIAKLINDVLQCYDDSTVKKTVQKKVIILNKAFPLYKGRK